LSLEWNIQGQQQYRVMMSNIPGRIAKEMFPRGVTPRGSAANELQMESCLQENIVSRPSFADLDRWMEKYQQADPEAPAALVSALSPALLGFFKSQVAMAIANLSGKTKVVATKMLPSPQGESPFYRVAEVHFPSMEALQECAQSVGGKRTLANAVKISSGGPPVIMIAEEETFTF
jgi:hypothetical protein